MIIYICVLSIITLFSLTQCKHTTRGRKRIIVFAFGLIVIIAALRKYTVGIDLEKYYYNSFIQYANWDWKDVGNNAYEPGYYYLNILIGRFTNNPQVFIAITSILSFSIFGWFIYKNSDNVFMSTFIFITFSFWFMFMNIIRQTLAIAIVLLAYDILNRQSLKIMRMPLFVGLILVATSFHNSAILMLCLLPLHYLKFQKKEIIGSVIAIVIAMLTYNKFFVLLASIMNHRNYVGAYLEKGNVDSGMITVVMIIIYALIFSIGAYRLIWKSKDVQNCVSEDLILNPYSNDFLMYAALIVLITRILSTRLTIIGRISYYFYPYIWILLPRIETNVRLYNNRRAFRFLVYSLGMVLFFVVGFFKAAEYYGTVPYEFFWQ